MNSKNFNNLLTAVLPKLAANYKTTGNTLNKRWAKGYTKWYDQPLPTSVRFDPSYVIWVRQGQQWRAKGCFPALLAKITDHHNVPTALYILPLIDGYNEQIQSLDDSARGEIKLTSTSGKEQRACSDLKKGIELWKKGYQVKVRVAS